MKKKLICLLLALCLLAGMLPAASASDVQDVVLRRGRTARVESAKEFLAAYKELWEPDSGINRICIMADMFLTSSGLRTPGGYDPYMPNEGSAEYEQSLCVRMPEGTCLDLNGHDIAIRAIQGFDASGIASIGTVVDTLGGGSLNLYPYNEPRFIDRAIYLANLYPQFVRTISITGTLRKGSDSEFTFPGNILLRFINPESALGAKKVTLGPGTTVEQVYAEAPAFANCGAVVMQYVDEADKNRTGCQYATQFVQVPGSIPTYPRVIYNLMTADGATVDLSSRPAQTAAQPAVIASAADKTAEGAVILNPSNVQLLAPRQLSYAELQALVQEVALAYYDQNPYIQYDGRDVSKVASLSRHGDDGRPEDAGFDSTVYSVCSNYPWKVYRSIFGTDYQLFRMSYARTRTWSDFPAGTPEVVYQYSGPLAKNSKGETDFEKAYAESRKAVQVGDIIVHSDDTNGHALMFMGDLLGDGSDYILHCKGNSYDPETGRDDREAPGMCIELMKADETVWGGEDAGWTLYHYNRSAQGFAILRPWQDPALPKLPTQEAMARVQFPRMKITRELDRYKFTGVQTGEEVPVYLTIENKGENELTEVPVEEYIPQGTTYVEGSATVGAKIEGSTLKWAVKIPAGKAVTLTYKVKVQAKLGQTVEFKGGLVGGIASRSMSLQVGGQPLSETQLQALYAGGMTAAGNTEYQDLAYFNGLYKNLLGLETGLPATAAELLSRLAEKKTVTVNKKTVTAALRSGTDALDKMIIPLHFTGQHAYATNEWEQVRELRYQFYEPGDIFVAVKGTQNPELMMYLGDGKVLCHTTAGTEVKSFADTLFSLLLHDLVIGLRPTLGHGNLNATKENALHTAADVSNGISLNVAVAAENLSDTGNYVQIQKGEKTLRIAQENWAENGTVAYDGIALKELTQPVTVGVYDAWDNLLTEKTLCLADLLQAQLETETNSAKAAEGEALLRAAAAAQKYFGYRTDDLADEDLLPVQTDVAAVRKDKSQLRGEEKQLLLGSSCVLGSSMRLKFYFAANNKDVYVNGEKVSLQPAGSVFCYCVDVKPAEMFKAVSVEVRDGSKVLAAATDSVSGNFARLYATGDAKAMALADAMLAYGLAAEKAN